MKWNESSEKCFQKKDWSALPDVAKNIRKRGHQWTMALGKTEVFADLGNNSYSGTVGLKTRLRGFGRRKGGKGKQTTWCHFLGRRTEKWIGN